MTDNSLGPRLQDSSSGLFLDAESLVFVRDELWKRPKRGACVLVGSGFSKNHAAPEADIQPPLTWLELTALLRKKLRPEIVASNVTATSNFESCLDLAEEYASSRGPQALDKFLLEHIPDHHEPHRLHAELLELPWADVFTTNWDTLLERAAKDLPSRQYSPVYTNADIGQADPPRIVKLHGSFPSQRPFIVTREHYRKYDTHYAALGHTIRQAFMESIVLMLGFSGDDSNFLDLHGWVRDHLQEDTPRLFLGGYLEFTSSRRRLLENRGIVPIDLAKLPEAANWGDDAHRNALQWILDVLSQPKDPVTRWPKPQGYMPPTPAGLTQPTPGSSEGTRHSEPPWPGQNASPEDEDGALHDLVRAWQQYRESYDGWVVLPFSKVSGMSATTDHWEEILLRRIKTWPASRRLIALRELSWRYEILMNPHKPDFAKAMTETVCDFDGTLDLGGPELEGGPDYLLECRNALLLSQLTEARCQFDEDQFRSVAHKVEGSLVQGTDVWHQFQYERCLWTLTLQDFGVLQGLLAQWHVDRGDRFWPIRKAAVLANMGAYEQALKLAEESVLKLEELADETKNDASISRLAWALQWRMASETQKLWNTGQGETSNTQGILDLWRQLAQYECDVRSEWERFEQAIATVRTPPAAGSISPPPHRRDVLRMDEYARYRHAYRAVRMIELAGIPTRIPGVRMGAETLCKAAEAMAGLGADHAFSAAVRAGSDCSPRGFRAVLSPGNMAILEQSAADRVVESLERGRDYRLAQAEGSGQEVSEGAAAAAANIEALARCMARARDEKAKAIFRWALEYSGTHGDRALHTVRGSVRALWQASWRSMRPTSRLDLLIELLSSSTLDTLTVSAFGDPADVLAAHDPTLRRGDRRDKEWSSCVTVLVDALRRGGGARERGARRLRWMLDAGLLKEREKSKMAAAWWDRQFLDEHGMPTDTTMFDFVQLSIPEPQPGIAVRALRRKWIGAKIPQANYGEVESTIAEVSAAWRLDLPWHRPVELSPEEEQWFWNLVDRWLRASVRRQRFTWGRDTERESRAIAGIAALVARREIPRRILGKLYTKLEVLSKPRQWVMMPIFHGNEYRLIAAAAGLGSKRSRRAETLLRVGMFADDERIQNSALHGLAWWITEGSKRDTRLRRPSRRCVEDLGVLLASQHEKGAIGAMEAATAVLEGQSSRDLRVVVPLAVEGLEKWWPVLTYSRPDVGGTDWDKTVVELRRSCVSLAHSLRTGGHSTHRIVTRWLDAGKDDPMAEVRYAAEGRGGFGLGP